MKRFLTALWLLVCFSGSAFAAGVPAVSNTLSAAGDIPLGLFQTSISTVTVKLTGGATLAGVIQVTTDGTNWDTVPAGRADTSALTGDGIVSVNVAGYQSVRAHVTSVTGTETITIVGGPGDYVPNLGGFDVLNAPTSGPTVQNAAYAAGNSEAGLLTIAAARTNGGSGIISNIALQSVGGSTNTIWIYLFSKSPASTCTDKAAFVWSNADRPYLIGGAPLSVTLGGAPGAWDTATYAALSNLTLNFKNADTTASPNIYACLVTGGSVTPATTTDLKLTIGNTQD